MADTGKDVPAFYTHNRHIYSFCHALNTIDVFLPSSAESRGGVWVVYIHGGAWRDPSKDSMGILPALHKMDPVEHGIAGVASINYGLSPYPDHPTNPSAPDDPSRNNVHPNHLEDVISALTWLHQKWPMGRSYIISGHSCGATLAFQVLSRSAPNIECLVRAVPRPTLPLGVVGLHGIYDLCQMYRDYGHVPAYAKFLHSAFGENSCGKWRVASPSDWPYEVLWTAGRFSVLAHSDEDSLVNMKQTEIMAANLAKKKQPERRQDIFIKTSGEHDEIWRKGDELARVLLQAVKMATTIMNQPGYDPELR